MPVKERAAKGVMDLSQRGDVWLSGRQGGPDKELSASVANGRYQWKTRATEKAVTPEGSAPSGMTVRAEVRERVRISSGKRKRKLLAGR